MVQCQSKPSTRFHNKGCRKSCLLYYGIGNGQVQGLADCCQLLQADISMLAR